MQSSSERVFPLMFEFGRLIRRKAHAHGTDALSLPQFEALYYIANAVEPLMREIADHLRVKAPTATALIEELAKSGYLVRVGDSADRRQVRLRLTPKGKKILESQVARKSRTIDEILGVLSKKEIEAFRKLLETIVTANK